MFLEILHARSFRCQSAGNPRCVSGETTDQVMVERHDRGFPLVGGKLFGDCRHQSVIAAFNAFQLDDKRHPPVNQIKHLAKRRYMVGGAANMQRSCFICREFANAALAACKAFQVVVVKDDHAAIPGQMRVAFDGEACLCRRIECGKGIFPARLVLVMQPAMCDWPLFKPCDG